MIDPRVPHLLLVAASAPEAAAVIDGAHIATNPEILPAGAGITGGRSVGRGPATAPASTPDHQTGGGLATWRGRTPAGHVTVVTAGIGTAATGAATAAALSCAGTATDRGSTSAGRQPAHPGDVPITVVICLGIAGGLAPVPVGAIVVADRIIHFDLGAESPEGFIPGHSLGWPTVTECPDDATALAVERAARAGLPVHRGPIATVSTVTGTAAGATRLTSAGILAEAMEGAGAAAAARLAGIPMMEIRSISNRVGPRDRSTWQVPLALESLSTAVAALLGQAWPT